MHAEGLDLCHPEPRVEPDDAAPGKRAIRRLDDEIEVDVIERGSGDAIVAGEVVGARRLGPVLGAVVGVPRQRRRQPCSSMGLDPCRDLVWRRRTYGVTGRKVRGADWDSYGAEHAEDGSDVIASLEPSVAEGGDEVVVVIAEVHLDDTSVDRPEAPLNEEICVVTMSTVDLSEHATGPIGATPSHGLVPEEEQGDLLG